MKTMYDRIKDMTFDEMRNFVYWIYMNGNKDGETGRCDSGGTASYFGGAMLFMDANKIMPNDTVEDLWYNFEEIYYSV